MIKDPARIRQIRTHNPRPVPFGQPFPKGNDARSIEARMSMAWWIKAQRKNIIAALDTEQYLCAVQVYGNARDGFGNDLSRLRPTEEREWAWIQECEITLPFWNAWGNPQKQAEMIAEGWRLEDRRSGQRLFCWTTIEQLEAYRKELEKLPE